MNVDESFFRIATGISFVSAFAMSAYFRTRAQIKGGKLRSAAGQRPVGWSRSRRLHS